ncbi:MAG: hypothetical protein GXP28_00465, partial [Planctomycetes bacterium]|nr:hypothetical protein [Planctomycetota bacterium]
DTPACWVAMHRMHHKYSDTQPDPHSPLVNFFWGHCGWLMVVNRDFRNVNFYEKFVRDILKDPFYLRLERNSFWTVIYAIHALLFFLVGFGVGWATGETAMDGVQFGLSLLFWGVFLRTVLTWHVTWSVNSVTHVWGYQNYKTGESSRNNLLVGLWSNGEGWHNNHHADQRAASHGHKWWEFDLTWLTGAGDDRADKRRRATEGLDEKIRRLRSLCYWRYQRSLSAANCSRTVPTSATSSLRSATCQGRSCTPPEALTTQLPRCRIKLARACTNFGTS